MARFREYPNSSTTVVYIRAGDGIVREIDIALIRYKITSQKTPVYNYNTRQYVAVADGDVIVTGMLGVNFSVAGYLYGLIELSKDTAAPWPTSVKSEPPAGRGAFAKFSDYIMQGGAVGELVRDKTQYKDFMNLYPEIPTGAEAFNRRPTQSPSNYYDHDAQTPVLHNTDDIIMEVQVGHSNGGNSIRVFEGVRFLDSEVAIDAKTGDPIMEIFTFFSKLGKPKHYRQ